MVRKPGPHGLHLGQSPGTIPGSPEASVAVPSPTWERGAGFSLCPAFLPPSWTSWGHSAVSVLQAEAVHPGNLL